MTSVGWQEHRNLDADRPWRPTTHAPKPGTWEQLTIVIWSPNIEYGENSTLDFDSTYMDRIWGNNHKIWGRNKSKCLGFGIYLVTDYWHGQWNDYVLIFGEV